MSQLKLNVDDPRLSLSLDFSGDTLFSSVVLCSPQPYSPLHRSLSAMAPGHPPPVIRCLSLSSLLDPNIDLPSMSAREVDDFLDRVPCCAESSLMCGRLTSTAAPAAPPTVTQDEPPDKGIKEVSSLFLPAVTTGAQTGGSECGGDRGDEEDHPKRCLSAPVPFWQDDYLMEPYGDSFTAQPPFEECPEVIDDIPFSDKVTFNGCSGVAETETDVNLGSYNHTFASPPPFNSCPVAMKNEVSSLKSLSNQPCFDKRPNMDTDQTIVDLHNFPSTTAYVKNVPSSNPIYSEAISQASHLPPVHINDSHSLTTPLIKTHNDRAQNVIVIRKKDIHKIFGFPVLHHSNSLTEQATQSRENRRQKAKSCILQFFPSCRSVNDLISDEELPSNNNAIIDAKHKEYQTNSLGYLQKGQNISTSIVAGDGGIISQSEDVSRKRRFSSTLVTDVDPSSGLDTTQSSDKDEGYATEQPYSSADRYRFICPHENCGKRYLASKGLAKHIKNHHAESVISCMDPLCKHKFHNIKQRDNHLKIAHPGQFLPYNCSQCSISFSQQGQLDTHIRKGHPPLELTCTVCDKQFASQYRLNQHSRRHTGEKLLPCPTCHKTFLNRYHLKRHQTSAHAAHITSSASQTTSVEEPPNQSPTPSISSDNENPALSVPTGVTTLSMTDTVFACPFETCDRRTSNRQEMSVHMKDHLAPDRCRLVYSCPLKDCTTVCEDQDLFHQHFVKHFTGELPGDINSLLPEDLPSTEDGMELPSMTFEANVGGMQGSQLMMEGSSLFHALDLIPDTMGLGDGSVDLSYDIMNQFLMPDLTSALTLPNLSGSGSRSKQKKTPGSRHSQGPSKSGTGAQGPRGAHNRTQSCASTGEPGTSNSNRSLTDKPVVESGRCARTCPVANDVMMSLVKRRRALLRERITLGYEPLATRQSALKNVMWQIYHSKDLPMKYQPSLSPQHPGATADRQIPFKDCLRGSNIPIPDVIASPVSDADDVVTSQLLHDVLC